MGYDRENKKEYKVYKKININKLNRWKNEAKNKKS